MFKNYLKVAIRNLTKQKYFSLINVFGLAFGITASVLIFLWVSHEMSYDRFHENSENIYRLQSDASIGGQAFDICYVPSPFGDKLKEICPEVELSTRISPYFDMVFKIGNVFYKEEKAIIADTNFFTMFSFNFLEGNPEKPFENNQSIVITKSMAQKYFGDEKALGKLIEYDRGDPSTVSAVIDDLPANSHIQLSFIYQLNNETNWGNFNRLTYIKVRDGFSASNLMSSINEIIKTDLITTLAPFFGTTPDLFGSSGNYINIDYQSLNSIHLNPSPYGELETGGNKTYVIFFTVIAFLIIFIAGINYMNLSTAYYDTRLTEVGIRKTNGATPMKLVWQFLTETALISLGAFMLGIILIYTFMPVFKNFLNIQIGSGISTQWYFPFIILFLVATLGIVSGIYPAIYLSRHRTISIIRNKMDSPIKGIFTTRSTLVVFQFIITIVVIISTILVQKQVKFLLNKDLGFNKEQIVVIDGANNLSDEDKQLLKDELEKSPMISNLCYSDTYPGENYNSITTVAVDGFEPGNTFVIKIIRADRDYFKTYEMKLEKTGELLKSESNVAILNENAALLMGLDNPLENILTINGTRFPVSGVVKNFHHDPLSISLDAIIIVHMNISGLNFLSIRLTEGNIKEGVAFINQKWSEITNNKPLELYFLDDHIRASYNAEMKAGKVFSAFSILSILIACMGILGIASFLIQRRIKEIGIRKAIGARTDEVTIMFLKDFVKWVIIAYVIACPLAWLAMHKWLQNFAYSTKLSWWIFILAGIIAFAIALATIFWQSLQAARKNPVEVLRYE